MKKKSAKNYVILACIYLAVIFLVLYFVKWYQTYQEYQMKVPIMRDVLQELLPEEVDHYVLENPDTLLYICSATDATCRNFEKDFRYYVKQKGLESNIIYVNLMDVENQESYLSDLGKKYGKEIDTKGYPMFLQFEEGNIEEVESELTMEKAKLFLTNRGYE